MSFKLESSSSVIEPKSFPVISQVVSLKKIKKRAFFNIPKISPCEESDLSGLRIYLPFWSAWV